MGRRLDFQIVHFEIDAAMTLQNVRVRKGRVEGEGEGWDKVWVGLALRLGL
jgi:hypothetical protein